MSEELHFTDTSATEVAEVCPIHPRKISVARFTNMPPRNQVTPHGDVSLTSRMQHDRYYLMANGPIAALRWLFPKHLSFEKHGDKFRHTFEPSSTPVTVMRRLQACCAHWQQEWNNHLHDDPDGAVAAAVPRLPSITTLGELYHHHQQHFVGQVSLQTKYKYPLHMDDWRRELGDHTPLAELTSEAILSARTAIQKKRKVSDSTMNGRVRTLKMMLNLAHRKKWVQHTCWEDVPDLRVVREPTRYWEPHHAAIAFRAAEQDITKSLAILMLALGLFLGLRKNEAVHLRWCDLDLDRMNPRTGEASPVCHIQQRDGFTTKTFEDRFIPISEEAHRLFLTHRPVKYQPTDYVLASERVQRKPRKLRNPIGPRTYRFDPAKAWIRVRDAAIAQGAPFIEFMEMRHSFACACLLAGNSEEEVAAYLGHATTAMIRRHYAHRLHYDQAPKFRLLT